MERIPRRHDDEADLPAQEAPPRQGTRLSRPNEESGRPPCPGRTPGPRSQAPVGLTTGRALGPAVVRNRVRRRLREAIRSLLPSLRPGWDVLVIARPAIVGADHRAIGAALGRLLARTGVLGERGGDMTGDMSTG